MFYAPSSEGSFFFIAIIKLKLTFCFVLLFWLSPVDYLFTGAEKIPPTRCAAQMEIPCMNFNDVATYPLATT